MSLAWLRCQWQVGALLSAILLVGVSMNVLSFAETQQMNTTEMIAKRAEAVWMDGAAFPALGMLEQGIRDNPDAFTLRKLRGDILTTTRRNQEALDDYEAILKETPGSLRVRWPNGVS